MKEYTIVLNQTVTAEMVVRLKVNSEKCLEELQEEIEGLASGWLRLARLNPLCDGIDGFIVDSLSSELEYDGEDGGDVSVQVIQNEKSMGDDVEEVAVDSQVDLDGQDTVRFDEENTLGPRAASIKVMTVSPALAVIVGPGPMARTKVTVKLWEYISKNGLQDNANRRMINADEKLKVIFNGKKQVSLFEMTKLVSRHLS